MTEITQTARLLAPRPSRTLGAAAQIVEILQDFRGGGAGIAGAQGDAGMEGGEGDGLVAVEELSFQVHGDQ